METNQITKTELFDDANMFVRYNHAYHLPDFIANMQEPVFIHKDANAILAIMKGLPLPSVVLETKANGDLGLIYFGYKAIYAIYYFMKDAYPLSDPGNPRYDGKLFSELDVMAKRKLTNTSFVAHVIETYSVISKRNIREEEKSVILDYFKSVIA